MSFLLEFSIFSLDGEESKSKDVAKIINMLEASNYNYELTSMGTIIETNSINKVLKIIKNSYKELKSSNRIYLNLKLDIRKKGKGRINKKIKSVQKKLKQL